MPGYVIHLAVAEEYLKKHKNKVEDYSEFINGVIAPDEVKDKSLTHYGEKSSKTNLYKYLQDNNINTSYNRGYFLHLITDYLFYNHYIEYFSNDMYNDYDILNEYLIEKYNVNLVDKIKDRVFYIKGDLKILNKELVNTIIKEISDYDLEDIEREIKANPEKWTKIRLLKPLESKD